MLSRATLVFAGLVLSSTAAAEPSADRAGAARDRTAWQEDAEAYCQLVTGTAGSESALLMSPTLFGQLDVSSGLDAPGDAGSLHAQPRLSVGASYSAAGLYRAGLLRDRARAECVRHRALSQLNAYIAAFQDVLTSGALSAKLAVLTAATPRAQEILSSTKAALEQSLATVDELDGLTLRVHDLLAEVDQTARDLQMARGRGAPPTATVAELKREHDAADALVERYNAALRRSYAWDVSVQGGYLHVFGARQDIPVFGALRASVNLGMMFQRGHDERAAAGRRRLTASEVGGTRDRVEQVILELTAAHRAEQRRLERTRALLAELEARLRSVEPLTDRRAKIYAQNTWFELVHVKAEIEYLRVHVEELARLLGEG
ncbi:hypothetical protein WMF31_15800 [Sorangium sp. So ce1036]|uniref:hypothetical protein n=1 Tax=Sorangium sp. So ce1036 TaxID=3133328 RepID=UPI003EFE647F